jgi:membrane protease YdiL (CAAX protease family)
MSSLVLALVVLAWVQLSRTPWRDLGFVRPKSWLLTVTIGVALGVVLKLVMKAVVMPLLGADPVNHVYHYVAGNPVALAGMIFIVVAGGGFGEELVYRGFLFERLGKLLGHGRSAKIAIVLITTAVFAAMHVFDQGVAGAEQAVFTGLVFGSIFAAAGRIWIPMIAHAAFDLAALALIYWNLEPGVAHLIFK